MLVYVIEDEENIRELIKFALETYGYEVEPFERAEEALERISERIPDVAIFDIMLPGIDGIEAVKRLRAESATADLPILMLTAKDGEIDKVVGLDCGADDYMTKPFSVLELSARIRALIRRSTVTSSTRITYEGLSVDTDSREVFVNGQQVELTYKEYELLLLLLKNVSKAMSRDEIMDRVWGYDFVGESRTLDIHISSLRQKLGSMGHAIKTVRNVGYKFSGGK